MKFPHFFIDRPIFAGVISIVITLVGVIALSTLPIAQYPQIAPPTIQVTTNYPGANAKVVSETVATPIEQQVNGVENMLYMSSQSTSDGNMTLSITFKLGTNLDTAQVLVQNRVAIAIPVLPAGVQRIGVTTKKQSPDITMVVHLVSPDRSLDQLFTSNYALLQIRDELARVDGVGDINVFGAREYSMRIWLDPHKASARGLTAQDVVQAIQEQNVQVAAGIVGAPPVPKGATAFQYTVSTQGRLADEKEFGERSLRCGCRGSSVAVASDPDDFLCLYLRRPSACSQQRAGAEMRQALETAVFFGMLGVTGFGLFLTPVFYVVIMWFRERHAKTAAPAPTQSAPPLGAEPAL